MTPRTPHEPEEAVMSADEVWDDARRLAEAFARQAVTIAASPQPLPEMRLPLALVLMAVDRMDRDELLLLRERIEDRARILREDPSPLAGE